MTLLKLCGTTSVEDARLAGRACADFCGILVDVEWSERSLTIPQARDAASGLRNVILLCNPSAAFAKEVAVTLRPYALQLLCQEPSVPCCRVEELPDLRNMEDGPPAARGRAGNAASIRIVRRGHASGRFRGRK
jgi:phosphoribosylanthranilate isomerase